MYLIWVIQKFFGVSDEACVVFVNPTFYERLANITIEDDVLTYHGHSRKFTSLDWDVFYGVLTSRIRVDQEALAQNRERVEALKDRFDFLTEVGEVFDVNLLVVEEVLNSSVMRQELVLNNSVKLTYKYFLLNREIYVNKTTKSVIFSDYPRKTVVFKRDKWGEFVKFVTLYSKIKVE